MGRAELNLWGRINKTPRRLPAPRGRRVL